MQAISRLILVFCFLLVPPALGEQVIESRENRDPLEAFNRVVFVFNDKVDTYFLRPIAKSYRYVMPDFAERGVTNVFANLHDANSAVNATLQGRLDRAAHGGGRFLVNSTFGVLGLFDIASRMGLESYPTDFGHTLAVWGMPQGPYIMVPVMGPRTLRSGAGNVVDVYAAPEMYVDDVRTRNTLFGLELVDGRARLLNADELVSGDRYIFVRDAYLQQREALVNDGAVEDSFSDFDANEDWEEF